MHAGDAAAKPIVRVEECAVHVCHRRGELEHFHWNGGVFWQRLYALEKLHGDVRPGAPVAQQAAPGDDGPFVTAGAETVAGEQVDNYVVVIAGVQRDLVIRIGYCPCHVHGAVPVERRALDGLYAFDPADLPPVVKRERPSAHGHLQVKAHHVHDLCHGAGALHHLGFAEMAEPAGAQ